MKKEEFWQIMREYMIAKQTIIYAIGEEDADFFFRFCELLIEMAEQNNRSIMAIKKKSGSAFFPILFGRKKKSHIDILVLSSSLSRLRIEVMIYSSEKMNENINE
jgi:hypothetical protein